MASSANDDEVWVNGTIWSTARDSTGSCTGHITGPLHRAQHRVLHRAHHRQGQRRAKGTEAMQVCQDNKAARVHGTAHLTEHFREGEGVAPNQHHRFMLCVPLAMQPEMSGSAGDREQRGQRA